MTFLDCATLAVHAVIVYAWFLFPALLHLLSRRRAATSVASGVPLPSVALVLSAYNEETHIARRVRNLLEMDYPSCSWRAFFGVDGSHDRTAAEAAAAAAGHPQVAVMNFAENRGKVAVLKDLVSRVRQETPAAEILVFTDANTDFEPQALRLLVAPFADRTVGGVCGKLLFVQRQGGKTDEGIYWKLENWLKERESDIDSCIGANGAIYAIRASLFWSDIPSNTIVDVFVIGVKVREQGYRMVYEPRAVAVEDLPEEIHHEWKRRIRIGAGDYQAIGFCRGCLLPRYGVFAWVFWSHKVLRWFTPHLMVAGLALAVAGAVGNEPSLGMVMLSGYAALAATTLLGFALRESSIPAARLVRAVQYFITMQAALFVGFLRFCRGNLEGRWQRTAR